MALEKQKIDMRSIICCLINMFCVGLVYMWSVFQNPVVEHFSWNPNAMTITSSVMIACFVFGTLIGGAIQDRTTPRFVSLIGACIYFAGLFSTSLLTDKYYWLIYITYGILGGLGVGFVYSAALSTVQKWMPHRRGLATGISCGSFGLSIVALTPVVELLLSNVGVPLTFRYLSIALVVILLVSSLFVKNPGQEFLSSLKLPARAKGRDYTPKEAVKTPEFWCIALSLFFLPAAYMMVIPIVKSLALARGISETQASVTVALIGVSSAVARISSGVLSDKLGRTQVIFILAVVMCVSSAVMTFADGILYSIVVLLIVFAQTGPSSVFPAFTTDAFGAKYSGTNYGLAFMFMGFSSLFFTWLSNVLNADGMVTGDYTVSFVVGAVCCVVPITLLPLANHFIKRRNSQDLEPAQEAL